MGHVGCAETQRGFPNCSAHPNTSSNTSKVLMQFLTLLVPVLVLASTNITEGSALLARSGNKALRSSEAHVPADRLLGTGVFPIDRPVVLQHFCLELRAVRRW
jgi:hypothetical protein